MKLKPEHIKIETSINGEVVIFIMPTTSLGTEILKTVKSNSKIQIVESTAATYHGKTLPVGTIVISQHQEEKALEQEEKVPESDKNNAEITTEL